MIGYLIFNRTAITYCVHVDSVVILNLTLYSVFQIFFYINTSIFKKKQYLRYFPQAFYILFKKNWQVLKNTFISLSPSWLRSKYTTNKILFFIKNFSFLSFSSIFLKKDFIDLELEEESLLARRQAHTAPCPIGL